MAYSILSLDFRETAVTKMLLPIAVVRNTLVKEFRLSRLLAQGMSFCGGQLIGIYDSRVPKIPKDAIAKES